MWVISRVISTLDGVTLNRPLLITDLLSPLGLQVMKAGLLLVTHCAGGLEAVIGLFSWRLNTEPLIEEML